MHLGSGNDTGLVYEGMGAAEGERPVLVINWSVESPPFPSRTALIGMPFWQQVLALAPGANPTGMLTSASWRGTVGRKY
jgi:hypothetical protein